MAARARFADMRITHPAHFDTFVEVALVGFVSVKDWRNKAALEPLSNIFTVADEAFAMLALENQIDDLVELVNKEGASDSDDLSDAATEKKVSKPRYTKMPVKEVPKRKKVMVMKFKKSMRIYKVKMMNLDLMNSLMLLCLLQYDAIVQSFISKRVSL